MSQDDLRHSQTNERCAAIMHMAAPALHSAGMGKAGACLAGGRVALALEDDGVPSLLQAQIQATSAAEQRCYPQLRHTCNRSQSGLADAGPCSYAHAVTGPAGSPNCILLCSSVIRPGHLPCLRPSDGATHDAGALPRDGDTAACSGCLARPHQQCVLGRRPCRCAPPDRTSLDHGSGWLYLSVRESWQTRLI